MFLRKVTSPRKNGPDAVYLQLAKSRRDPETGKVKTEIVHSFGRTDELDYEPIRRLARRLNSHLPPEEQAAEDGDLTITDTWQLGGTHLLDGLWRELELDRFFEQALAERSFATDIERALFALVAQRALAPDSKLAGARWAGHTAWIPGLPEGGQELEVQHFYRAMDFLEEAMGDLREHLYFQITNLLNADVSVIFYDTTSVSFEIGDADPEGGLRRYGHSKKKRPDLPQVILALAINRDGLPVRHWVFPGNTVDVTTVEQVTEDLAGLRPRRYLFVGDRGMVSQENIDYLESRQRKYLLGGKLRADTTIGEEVLSIRGRYARVTETLGVKETVLEDGDRPMRYLLCRDSERAKEEAATREQILGRLEQILESSRASEAHTQKACDLMATAGYKRYLRELKSGGLRIDRAAVKEDKRTDGKYVLMTNDLETPPDELALGYRDMWRAERAFRTMKTSLHIEPVYHRKPGRITSHAHICVLAYLLMKVAENRTETSWTLLREELQRISLSRLEIGNAAAYQRKQLTAREKSFWNKTGLDQPPEILQVE